jgi:hypothetical protein
LIARRSRALECGSLLPLSERSRQALYRKPRKAAATEMTRSQVIEIQGVKIKKMAKSSFTPPAVVIISPLVPAPFNRF